MRASISSKYKQPYLTMTHTLYRYKFDYMCATRPVHETRAIGRPPERPATTTPRIDHPLAGDHSCRSEHPPGPATARAHPSAAVRGHQCRFAVSAHLWALQRIVATARGWVTRFRTRKLKITKMASDLRRRLDAWPTAATTIAAFWRGSKTRQWIGAWPAAVTKIAAF